MWGGNETPNLKAQAVAKGGGGDDGTQGPFLNPGGRIAQYTAVTQLKYIYIYIYIYATPPSGTYVFVLMLHIDVTCTQALDTRNQETLCIAYWGDLSPRHTKPRNFTHRLLGGPVASLMGGDLSPRHTKPRNFMHRLLGGS